MASSAINSAYALALSNYLETKIYKSRLLQLYIHVLHINYFNYIYWFIYRLSLWIHELYKYSFTIYIDCRHFIFKQTTCLTFLQFTDFCVLDISKTNKVRNMKQAPKVVKSFNCNLYSFLTDQPSLTGGNYVQLDTKINQYFVILTMVITSWYSKVLEYQEWYSKRQKL